jgi:hypothetical protein
LLLRRQASEYPGDRWQDHRWNITHSAPIAHAGELLLKAAETGKRADIEAATEQIERELRSNRMMA